MWRRQPQVQLDLLADAQAALNSESELDRLRAENVLSPLRHRPSGHTGGAFAISDDPQRVEDRDLVARIIAAYRKAHEREKGHSQGSLWDHIAELNRSIHEALVGGEIDEVADKLRNPSQTMLFWGFDGLNQRDVANTAAHTFLRQFVYDNLLRLAEATAAHRLYFPEAPHIPANPPDVDGILRQIDDVVGARIEFPNPFAGEAGVRTSRGVASYRAVQSVYQGWRIATLVPGGTALEIGAGLGRTAFHSRALGVASYTLVDLPMTCVAQAYYLGRTLGPDQIRLYGEKQEAPIRIMPPAAFFESSDRFDLVLNVDSITEMAETTARRYWKEIERRTDVFLSINHEANPLTMRDLYKGSPAVRGVTRTPYWMRHGYVEELLQLDLPT